VARAAGRRRFELITSISDPLISNGGDGSFHPFDESQVRSALSQVRFPLPGLSADVFLLPYPRPMAQFGRRGQTLQW